MSYYLGLVGLGLFFVLLVHLYNRWTYFVFQRKNTQNEDLNHSSNIESQVPKAMAKEPMASSRNSTGSSTVGNINGTAGEQRRQALFSNSNASSSTMGLNHINAQLEDETLSIKQANDNVLPTHQSFFVSGLDKLSTEELHQWLETLFNVSAFVIAIKLLTKNKEWHHGASTIADSDPDPQPILSCTQIKPLIPIVQAEVVLQLANRSGHFIREEWSGISQAAAAVDATFPEDKKPDINLHAVTIEPWLKQAQQLDSMCAEFDVQIALTLMCRESAGVSGGQISRAASQEGMVFSKGFFHKLNADGFSIFSLEFPPAGNANTDKSQNSLASLENQISTQVTLSLDIPRIVNGQNAFRDMARFAQHLAGVIRADLVDDRGHQLSSISLDTIGEQVQHIQTRMKTSGLAPGSAIARQLFS